MEKRFYTVKELAAELGGIVSKGTIYRMVHLGMIPARRINTRIVIPADWVTGYLSEPCNFEEPSEHSVSHHKAK